jgi:hypothetical protein
VAPEVQGQIDSQPRPEDQCYQADKPGPPYEARHLIQGALRRGCFFVMLKMQLGD